MTVTANHIRERNMASRSRNVKLIDRIRLRWHLVALSTLLLGCATDPPTRCKDAPAPPDWVAYEEALDISDDGTLIVFNRAESANRPDGTYLLDRSAPDSLEFIKPVAPYEDWFRISPDGHKVAYAAREIFLYERMTGSTRRLTFTNGNAAYPTWDPTSRYLAYSRPERAQGTPDSLKGTFILDTVTGSERWLNVNQAPVFAENLFWSPDGTRLAFDQYQGAARRVWILDLATHEVAVPLQGIEALYQVVIGWFGADTIIVRASESRTQCVSFWAYRRGTSQLSAWPVNLDRNKFREPISRSGTWMCFTDLDSTARGGVLFIQRPDDRNGSSRRQVSDVTPYVGRASIEGSADGRRVAPPERRLFPNR